MTWGVQTFSNHHLFAAAVLAVLAIHDLRKMNLRSMTLFMDTGDLDAPTALKGSGVVTRKRTSRLQ